MNPRIAALLVLTGMAGAANAQLVAIVDATVVDGVTGTAVLGALGGIALLLTVLGTYVIAQSMVVRRRRELGIRAALGARSAQLHRLVMRDTARLVGVGLLAGLMLAIARARLIRSLLYQVEPLDPLVLATVVGGIFALALLVSLRPALEATRADFTRSLRED